VTVATVTPVAINVVGTIVFGTGYSLDGAGATIACRPTIGAAVNAYLATLGPGDDVMFHRVAAAIVGVTGVADVTGLTLNGSAANVALTSLQVAAPGTYTLS
jgi:uncharacterized phage protein gp47/JayE